MGQADTCRARCVQGRGGCGAVRDNRDASARHGSHRVNDGIPGAVGVLLGAPVAKVQVCSRLAATELYRRLREFELDAVIVHPETQDSDDVDLVPLYEEQYVLLSPADMLPPGTSTLVWRDAAQLPLALLTADMRDRQVIDAAFADHAVSAIPQVETDSVASLFAQVATGNWASIVPHTWLWAMPMSGPTGGEIRAVELVDPVLKAQIALATNALGPGSPVARALITCAQALALNEFFDTQLRGITRRR